MSCYQGADTSAKIPHVPSKSSTLSLLASAYRSRQHAASTGSPAAWLRCAVEARRAMVQANRLAPSHWVDLLIEDADTMLLRAVQQVAWIRARGVEVAS